MLPKTQNRLPRKNMKFYQWFRSFFLYSVTTQNNERITKMDKNFKLKRFHKFDALIHNIENLGPNLKHDMHYGPFK